MPGDGRRAALEGSPPTGVQRRAAARAAEAALCASRPAWKRAVSFLLWVLAVILCAAGARLAYRYWRVSQLAPRLAGIRGKPDDAALGGLVNLRCGAADARLLDYALESPLRCYSPRRRFFLWTAPPGADGTQLLMYYRVVPGSEGALLPWNRVWRGNGVSYRSVRITGLEFRTGGEKLGVEFKLSKALSATTGLPAEKRFTAEFPLDEFVKLVQNAELDVPKAGLSHPDLGWPANLLERAGELTPEVLDKLRGK